MAARNSNLQDEKSEAYPTTSEEHEQGFAQSWTGRDLGEKQTREVENLEEGEELESVAKLELKRIQERESLMEERDL